MERETMREVEHLEPTKKCDQCGSTSGTVRYDTFIKQANMWGYLCHACMPYFGTQSSVTTKIRYVKRTS